MEAALKAKVYREIWDDLKPYLESKKIDTDKIDSAEAVSVYLDHLSKQADRALKKTAKHYKVKDEVK